MILQQQRSVVLKASTRISSLYCRKQNLRLRPPVSHSETAATSATQQQQLALDSYEHATVMTVGGRDPMVVCWHPPKPFPYEHTKPVERSEEELRQGESPVRADLRIQYSSSRLLQGIPYPELQNMFYTEERAFHRHHRAQRIKQTLEKTPVDRKGL